MKAYAELSNSELARVALRVCEARDERSLTTDPFSVLVRELARRLLAAPEPPVPGACPGCGGPVEPKPSDRPGPQPTFHDERCRSRWRRLRDRGSTGVVRMNP